MTVQTINKAAVAQAIYVEEAAKGDDKLRARVITRFKAELGMSPQGSSTYFQNCKTKAAGLKVKHYYKAKGNKSAKVVEMEAQLLLLTHQATDRWAALQGDVAIGFKTRTQAQDFAKVNELKVIDRNKAA